MLKAKKNEILNGVNLENLVVYPIDGGKYVIVSKFAEVLRTEKSLVYNATARLSKEHKDLYIKTLKIDGTNPKRKDMNKCIELGGLKYVFDKMQNKFSQDEADVLVRYITEYANQIDLVDITESSCENSEEINSSNDASNTYGSNVVDFIPSSSTMVLDLNTEEVIESDNCQVETSNEVVANENTTDDISDIFGVLNGISSILEEHRVFKQRIPGLEAENKLLQAENLELKNRIAELEANPIDTAKLDKLEQENVQLRAKLEASNKANNDIMKKANMIKNYVMQNR